jgi:hypothetical protein
MQHADRNPEHQFREIAVPHRPDAEMDIALGTEEALRSRG